tara:strand:+ start:4261 stop:4944 length:684 start_codon:yes stop_codon:yes gene_type:complete
MTAIVFGPEWFSGLSIIFELVTVLVTLLISLYSYKLYLFSKERRFLYFGISFLAIMLSFLAKIATTLASFYVPSEPITEVVTNLTISITSGTPYLTSLGFLVHQELMLLGLAGIYLINQKNRSILQAALLTYLVTVITIISNAFYFIFYATATVFLALISHYYVKNYIKKQTNTSFLIMISFLFILLSQIVFILVILNPTFFFIIAEIIQLIGYALLLNAYTHITTK